jgi:hypothetical protein
LLPSLILPSPRTSLRFTRHGRTTGAPRAHLPQPQHRRKRVASRPRLAPHLRRLPPLPLQRLLRPPHPRRTTLPPPRRRHRPAQRRRDALCRTRNVPLPGDRGPPVPQPGTEHGILHRGSARAARVEVEEQRGMEEGRRATTVSLLDSDGADHGYDPAVCGPEAASGCDVVDGEAGWARVRWDDILGRRVCVVAGVQEWEMGRRMPRSAGVCHQEDVWEVVRMYEVCCRLEVIFDQGRLTIRDRMCSPGNSRRRSCVFEYAGRRMKVANEGERCRRPAPLSDLPTLDDAPHRSIARPLRQTRRTSRSLVIGWDAGGG